MASSSVPALTSLHDRLQIRREKKPFPPRCFWSLFFITREGKLEHSVVCHQLLKDQDTRWLEFIGWLTAPGGPYLGTAKSSGLGAGSETTVWLGPWTEQSSDMPGENTLQKAFIEFNFQSRYLRQFCKDPEFSQVRFWLL